MMLELAMRYQRRPFLPIGQHDPFATRQVYLAARTLDKRIVGTGAGRQAKGREVGRVGAEADLHVGKPDIYACDKGSLGARR